MYILATIICDSIFTVSSYLILWQIRLFRAEEGPWLNAQLPCRAKSTRQVDQLFYACYNHAARARTEKYGQTSSNIFFGVCKAVQYTD